MWDMLRFNAHVFIDLMQLMQAFKEDLSGTGADADNPRLRENCKKVLFMMKRHLELMGLPMSIKALNRTSDELDSDNSNFKRLGDQFEELSRRVIDELEDRIILVLSSRENAYYDPKSPLFGEGVDEKFPNLNEEIAEAGKCYAVGRYTACVFHLMRVLEIGIQEFAKVLGVTIQKKSGAPMSWGDIENAIQPAIDSLPATDSNRAEYSAVRLHFRDTRWAWRNDTMHPKANYTQEQAERVFGSAKSFISDLVRIL